MNQWLSEYFFYYYSISAIVRFLLILMFSLQFPIKTSEKKARYLVNIGIVVDCIHLVALLAFYQYLNNTIVTEFLYLTIDLHIIWNFYSIVFFVFSIILLSIIAKFSVFYLHRDKYFFKFFSLFYILELAICFLVLTENSESLFIGWELLGLSSVLLIAFYEHRPQVLKNALTILVIYKLSDVIFYSALIYGAFVGNHSYLQGEGTLTLSFILISCLIKSSIFPIIWLPRAMEGPTPSSAVFYGGLSTHLACFIFLSAWSHAAEHNIYLIIIATALTLSFSVIASLMSKQTPDIKNAIAYASIAQLGLIYIETLWGYYTFALMHCVLNGLYRTIEFLKSPSLLYQHHSIEQNRNNRQENERYLIESRFPLRIKQRLYFFIYHEFIFPRFLISTIQGFLGLHTTSLSTKSLINYFLTTLSFFIIFEIFIYFLFRIPISFFDELLFMVAFGFHIIAIIHIVNPVRFFISLSASTLAVFQVLLQHTFIEIHPISFLYFLLLGYFIMELVISRFTKHSREVRDIQSSRSNFFKICLLAVGISLVGIPGLLSFIVWENLEHVLLKKAPDIITDGFSIMALNTILFFRFYFINYLGSNGDKEVFHLVERE